MPGLFFYRKDFRDYHDLLAGPACWNKTQALSREEWLSVRRRGIGSSDAEAALGLNPRQSMLELWMIKTGRVHMLPQIDPGDRTTPTYWGSLLEPIVAAHYTYETGNKVNAQIDAAVELGTFIFRTTGYNSIRTLTARLQYYHAASGNLLAALPLELRLRRKSTAQSHRTSIYYVDLTIREGTTMEEAIRQARALHHRRVESGFDQPAQDKAAKELANGQFEESEEELAGVTDEFLPSSIEPNTLSQEQGAAGRSLAAKIKKKPPPIREIYPS